MTIQKLPTKLYLHLSGTYEGAAFTVFTADVRESLKDYPFVCEFEAKYPAGVTDESVNEQLPQIRLGALYQQAGKARKQLDDIEDQIKSLLAIGYDKPIKVEAELMPREEPHTSGLTTAPDGRIVNGPKPKDCQWPSGCDCPVCDSNRDDEIPF